MRIAEVAEPFRIESSLDVATQFKEMFAQAKAHGLGDEFLAVAERVLARLERDPLFVGEPHYNFRTLKLVVCVCFIAPFCVHYAVDEERRLVLIRQFRFHPPHGSEQP